MTEYGQRRAFALNELETSADLREAIRIEPEILSLLQDAKNVNIQLGYDWEKHYTRLKARATNLVGWEATNPKLIETKYYDAVIKVITNLLPGDDDELEDVWGDLIYTVRRQWQPETHEKIIDLLAKLQYSLTFTDKYILIIRGDETYRRTYAEDSDKYHALYRLARHIISKKIQYNRDEELSPEYIDDYIENYQRP
jgi:hypothetical protein